MKQLSLFPEENNDPRAPVSTNWNLLLSVYNKNIKGVKERLEYGRIFI
jgi:hypothetical protein